MRGLFHSDNDSDTDCLCPILFFVHFYIFLFLFSFVHDGMYYSWMEEIFLLESIVCKQRQSERWKLFLLKICIKKCELKSCGAVEASGNVWEVRAASLFFVAPADIAWKTHFSFPFSVFFLSLHSLWCKVQRNFLSVNYTWIFFNLAVFCKLLCNTEFSVLRCRGPWTPMDFSIFPSEHRCCVLYKSYTECSSYKRR
jgi:hypothetical protein